MLVEDGLHEGGIRPFRGVLREHVERESGGRRTPSEGRDCWSLDMRVRLSWGSCKARD